MKRAKKHKGNYDKVMADADIICRRLKETDATLTSLRKEYRCHYDTLKKAILSVITKAQWRYIRKKKNAQGGIRTRFQKGHVPPNKGKKGIHQSPQTEFKKGHLPACHKHVGTNTIRKDKCGKLYRFIKISGIMQGHHDWTYYSRYIWEQINGPVPEGFLVVHIDGDTLNDDISNLRLVDRAGHLALIRSRDPHIYKKISRRRSKTMRKKRKIKEQQRKIKNKSIISQKLELLYRQQSAAAEAPIARAFWQCKSCSQSYGGSPPDICPKCNGIWFEKIEHRKKAI